MDQFIKWPQKTYHLQSTQIILINTRMKVEQFKRHKHKKRTLIVEKSFRQIQLSQKALYLNIRTYKGNRKDTNLLNINFKTIINRILDQMCQTKEVYAQQIISIQKYKESTPSFVSLIQLIYQKILNFPRLNQDSQKKQIVWIGLRENNLKNKWQVKSPNILRRLRELFESSQITRRVFFAEGTVINKLLMLKYLQAIRYTVIGDGEIVKWKQLKSVTVLK